MAVSITSGCGGKVSEGEDFLKLSSACLHTWKSQGSGRDKSYGCPETSRVQGLGFRIPSNYNGSQKGPYRIIYIRTPLRFKKKVTQGFVFVCGGGEEDSSQNYVLTLGIHVCK